MRLHILAVDADPEARSVYRILFARECLTVAASAAGVALAGRWDVVITDGVRPLRELRVSGSAFRIIHSYGPLDEMEWAFMAGLCEWLFEKPSWLDLHEQVRRLAPKSPTEFRPRTARRAKLSLNMFLRTAEWSAPRRLQTVDVSERGLAFMCTEPLAPGEAIHIALLLPCGARLRLLAVVRHSTPVRNGSKATWLVGAEIRELHKDERYALSALLEDCFPK
jgi:hypothetical protein